MTYGLESQKRGTAFFERLLCQTDQGNEEERSALIRRLQYHYRDELTLSHEDIEAGDLSRVIANASESAPGPDGVK